MAELQVHKIGAYIPFSDEMLRQAEEDRAAWQRWEDATPEQRAAWIREAAERRAAERAAAQPAELTVDALIDALGWTRAYAEHVVQPYCRCSDGSDGWDYCQHATDLELTR